SRSNKQVFFLSKTSIKMNKWMLVWCLLSGCFSSNRSQPPALTTVQLKSQTVQTAYNVIGIRDGDTFELLMDGKEQAVRLAHIDCPERRQPFGTRARQYASDLCFGQMVTLLHQGKYDRYKRLIAEVILKDGR